MKLCPSNIIALLILLEIGSVIGQNKNRSKLDNLIEHYGNLSKAYNEKILNGFLPNVIDELSECKLPPTNAGYKYYTINSQDYNLYPIEGEYVNDFTILLIKCNAGIAGEPFDKNIDDVVVCENGTWNHEIKCKRDPCVGACPVENTNCVIIGDEPSCKCIPGYHGNPLRYCYLLPETSRKPPMASQSDPNSQLPQASISCGLNAFYYNGTCLCGYNYHGNPDIECMPGCKFHTDCPSQEACIRNDCTDPCTELCGRNAICKVIKHNAICNCPPGQFGDPFFECKSECIFNAQCPKDKNCLNNKCVDPCPGLCGKNAKCDIVNYVPTCYCPPGQYGDPFVECKAECLGNDDCLSVEACIDYKCADPCPGTCGKNAICNIINQRPVCSCPPNSAGDPSVECKSECLTNSDCLKEETCINNKCIDPCIKCGKRAKCIVIKHTPECHCPPGLTGNPFDKCESILDTNIICKQTSMCTVKDGSFQCNFPTSQTSNPFVECKSIPSTTTTPVPNVSTIRTKITSSIVSSSISENSCLTPPFPNNGSYLTNGIMKPEGKEVAPFTVLTYNCDRGFALNSENANSVCYEKKWVPELVCKRLCENLASYTLKLTCTYQGGKIDCNGPMIDGVIVTMVCEEYHQKPKRVPLKPLICENGSWSGILPRCEPECGEDKSRSQPYAIGAAIAEPNTAPWHIGIYEKSGRTYEYRCGGTIVSNKVIISAAHCFKQNSEEFTRHKKYKIAVGKYYSDWTDERDDENESVQKLGIEKVYIPDTYGGQSSLMQSDLAIIVVKNVIEFSNSVHAACIDMDSLFASVQVTHGKKGKVIGWGVTEEGNSKSISNELRQSVVPVVNRAKCRAGVPETFKRYTQVIDKFCAGALKGGPTVCSGDSGGGFVVSVREKDIDKWYLFGVVSIGPIDENSGSTCKSNSYTMYTDITKHSDYIIDVIFEYGG